MQFEWQTGTQQLLDEYSAIVVVEREHIGYEVATLVNVDVNVVADDRVVRELYFSGYLTEQFLVFLCCADYFLFSGFVGAGGVVLEEEILLQLTRLGLEAFRKHDVVVGDGMLYVEYRQR